MSCLESLSNHYYIVVALFLAAIVFATACSSPTVVTPGGGGSDTAPLTQDALRNAEYQGIYQEAVRLTDGKYEGEPFVEGGASRPTVTFTDAYTFGDLDGDDVDDAVVVLAESSGGSGSFLYLAAVLNRNGNPENVAIHFLGDRGQVQAITVIEGEITINVVTHGPDDPMCCPTHEVMLKYRLEGQKLIKVSEETTDSKESAATEEPAVSLESTRWILVSYTNGQGETVDVLPNSEITTEFTADQVAGNAGCNNYFASYQVKDNTITIGPVGATRMACSEPDGIMEQEDAYLAALESAAIYQVAGNELALTGADGVLIATFAKATGSDIVGVVWKWERFDDGAGDNNIVVDDPNKYTLELLTDGTYQVKADCNLSGGGYTLKGNSITLLPGPTTLAECEPGSLYDEYLTRLGDAVTFVLDGDRLVLNLKADAGNMVFTRDEASASGPSEAGGEIIDVPWQWAGLVETAPAAQSVVPDPENYTLVFQSDGTLDIKADCNMVGGSYTLEGNALIVELGPSTMAFCGEQSLDQQYLELLSNVGSYAVEGGQLVLNLKAEAGRMTFVRAVVLVSD